MASTMALKVGQLPIPLHFHESPYASQRCFDLFRIAFLKGRSPAAPFQRCPRSATTSPEVIFTGDEQ